MTLFAVKLYFPEVLPQGMYSQFHITLKEIIEQ